MWQLQLFTIWHLHKLPQLATYQKWLQTIEKPPTFQEPRARPFVGLARRLVGHVSAVHDKLDATINDLKGKPDTVNKRLRYKLDSTAVAAWPNGAAAIAGKIADGVACKNRTVVPTEQDAREAAQGARRPQCPETTWTRRRARPLTMCRRLCWRRRRTFPARSPLTRLRSASALTMNRETRSVVQCEERGGAPGPGSRGCPLTARRQARRSRVRRRAGTQDQPLRRSVERPHARLAAPLRRRQPFWCVEPHNGLSDVVVKSSTQASTPIIRTSSRTSGRTRARSAATVLTRRQRLRRRLQQLQPRRRHGQRFTGRPLARLALRGHDRGRHEQRHWGRGRRRRERLS